MSSTTRAHIEVHPTGQSIGLVAGGASVQVSGEGSVEVSQATPLTKKGEEIVTYTGSAVPEVPMQHAAWAVIDTDTTGVTIIPSEDTMHAKSMQLLLAPSAALSTGWLASSTASVPVIWPYGEPPIAAGFRYCITLVQIPSVGILANMTPLGVA